jgi:hypothetical protein
MSADSIPAQSCEDFVSQIQTTISRSIDKQIQDGASGASTISAGALQSLKQLAGKRVVSLANLSYSPGSKLKWDINCRVIAGTDENSGCFRVETYLNAGGILGSTASSTYWVDGTTGATEEQGSTRPM